jgi:RNase P/RNase MRP subunit p29
MFHVKDGLWVEKRIGADCPGYSRQEEIANFYKIRVLVTETDTATVINDSGNVSDESRQNVVFDTKLDVYQLASIMATLSVRGENTETFNEALAFLRKEV